MRLTLTQWCGIPFVSILINNPDLATVSVAVSNFQRQCTTAA
ncbi:hypothetical protein AERO9AM_20251 [Aeromicrobium sp. 9AM]|nr:hypothetical protein AERO9AM_20251 [Aeromicrobium sp. 9AM]